MSRQFGLQAVKSYDEQFRKVKKLMNLDWGLINDVVSLHTGVYVCIVYLSTPHSAIGPTIYSR
jgi:hypothetical protein